MGATPQYEGPDRRRRDSLYDTFERAVEEASKRAAQEVAQISRRRQTVYSITFSLLALLAIITIAWYAFVRPQERNFALRNAIYDCQLFQRSASAMSNFVHTDADLRVYQNSKGFLSSKIIEDLTQVLSPAAVNDLRNVAIQNQKVVAFTVAEWTKDANILNHITNVDCVKHLTR